MAAKDSRDHEKAQKVLLESFPNIPKGTCSEILEHGFEKGSGRVGRSQKLEDRIKVHLAVYAHIRHRLTQYDSILAANKGQDARLAAREMVYGQVQAIADSWRATSSQVWNTEARTSIPRDSTAILEANRQRRDKLSKTQTVPTDGPQVLEKALGGLRLDEDQREAEVRVDAATTAQRRSRKAVRKFAGKDRFREMTQELLRQYELDPSIKMTKRQKKGVLRLQMEQKERLGKGKSLRNVHKKRDPNRTKPTKQENRKLRVTANGVELEPREPDRYVPDYGPSDDQPPEPRLLRSSYRKSGKTPSSKGDLVDTPVDGMQLEASGARGHDRYVPSDGSPRNLRYPLRSNCRKRGDIHIYTDGGVNAIEEPTREGRLSVEDLARDSELMDIDDISLKTAGIHLG